MFLRVDKVRLWRGVGGEKIGLEMGLHKGWRIHGREWGREMRLKDFETGNCKGKKIDLEVRRPRFR